MQLPAVYSRRIPVVGELFDVVDEAEALPLPIERADELRDRGETGRAAAAEREEGHVLPAGAADLQLKAVDRTPPDNFIIGAATMTGTILHTPRVAACTRMVLALN